MKKAFLWISGIAAFLYLLLCTLFYIFQDRLLFHPTVVSQEYTMDLPVESEELFIEMDDGIKVHGLLLKSDSSRGLVFYLHGNRGTVWSRNSQATLFLDAGFDFFMLDYRGYGKSDGKIGSEDEFYDDALAAFRHVRKRYPDKPVIVYGYSLGTGPATRIAAREDVELLVLLAPYYSMVDIKNLHYPVFPTFLMKYPLRTYQDYEKVDAPILLVHGTDDTLIPHKNSMRLEQLNSRDSLVLLENQTHNRVPANPHFMSVMTERLEKL